MNDKELLGAVAQQIEKWADESTSGGWSTQQVAPMRKIASNIYEHLGRSE